VKLKLLGDMVNAAVSVSGDFARVHFNETKVSVASRGFLKVAFLEKKASWQSRLRDTFTPVPLKWGITGTD
jgi:hypothetical protein